MAPVSEANRGTAFHVGRPHQAGGYCPPLLLRDRGDLTRCRGAWASLDRLRHLARLRQSYQVPAVTVERGENEGPTTDASDVGGRSHVGQSRKVTVHGPRVTCVQRSAEF